ncbi:hypothetical protein GCM10012275_54290 [Longimycelium tulufanense]|uniref:Uncharacterized protein n=1 Tax=Longimycelium tulufanense TaxID=907463 RepID=A0A8J3FWF6_9PSEU|nr:hypothetical protein [Longimycelium tulufanense]GGM76731.1 hypothetical protein GCM10012275_54290 [Longimycelium tulufanense]
MTGTPPDHAIPTSLGTAGQRRRPEAHAVPLPPGMAAWFPLLPRTRPAAAPLDRRVAEIGHLAAAAPHEDDEHRQLVRAAETLNKAALIASDTGCADLAHQLCWRQLDLWLAAAPLDGKRAKLALEPLVNLGRLAIRAGDAERAHRLYEDAFHAVHAATTVEIDGRHLDFRHLISGTEERAEPVRFLWRILLADGTRALTRAGRWADALHHLQRYKGIGERLWDGRQVAVLAACATGNPDRSVTLLAESYTPGPWEQAIAACLRTLCLRAAQQPTGEATTAMAHTYLGLEPAVEHLLFRTRLGLVAGDLADDTRRPLILDRVICEAVSSSDAHSARDVLTQCRPHLKDTEQAALTATIEKSGLQRRMIPPELLDELMTAVSDAEEHMKQTLREARRSPR